MSTYILDIHKLYLFFISNKYNYDDILNNFYEYLINYIISILNIKNKDHSSLFKLILNQLKSKINFNTIFLKINKIPYYAIKSNINITYMLCNINKDPLYINMVSNTINKSITLNSNTNNTTNKSITLNSNNMLTNTTSNIIYNNICKFIVKKDYSLPTTNWLVIFNNDKYNIVFNSQNFTNITIKISLYISSISNYYIGLYNYIDNNIQLYNKFTFNKSKIQVCIFDLVLQQNTDYKFKLIHKINNINNNFEIRGPLSIIVTNTVTTSDSVDNKYISNIVSNIDSFNIDSINKLNIKKKNKLDISSNTTSNIEDICKFKISCCDNKHSTENNFTENNSTKNNSTENNSTENKIIIQKPQKVRLSQVIYDTQLPEYTIPILQENEKVYASAIKGINNSGTYGLINRNNRLELFYNNSEFDIDLNNGLQIKQIQGNKIINIDSDQINSGIFSLNRIPDLDASKITTGQFDSDMIPNLDANKITTGHISLSIMPITPLFSIYSMDNNIQLNSNEIQINSPIYIGLQNDIHISNNLLIGNNFIQFNNNSKKISIGNGSIYTIEINGSNGNYTALNSKVIIDHLDCNSISTIHNITARDITAQQHIQAIDISANNCVNAADIIAENEVSATDVSAQNIYSTSDRRLKYDLIKLNEDDVINTIMSINSYKYRFKKCKTLHSGFIAQELIEIIPHCVTKKKDNYFSVNYLDIISYIVCAVQNIIKRLIRIEEKLNI